MAYLGKWKWAFANLGVVLLMGIGLAILLPEKVFDHNIRLISIAFSAGSGGLAYALALQMNQAQQGGGGRS